MRNFRFPAIASITGTTTRISSHRHVEQKASGSLDSSCWYPRRIIRSAGHQKYKENGGRHGSTRSAEAHCGKGGTPMGTKAPGTGSCLEEFTIRGAEHDCDRSPGHPPRETCVQIAARRSSIDAVRATTKPLSAPHQRSRRRQLFPP